MAEKTQMGDGPVGADQAWELLLAFAAAAKNGQAWASEAQTEFAGAESTVIPDSSAPRSWLPAPGVEFTEEAVHMLDLYMPLCVGPEANEMVVAHLGQSLDGRIATTNGASQFITGDENLVHTHRLRALFDAVVVGAHTAQFDNPRLTTRLASGDHATRVLIDPTCTADSGASIFVDGISETLVIGKEECVPSESAIPYVGLATIDGVFTPEQILGALRKRGLLRIFIEGGGITVSEFLRAGALDRLHICVAPMIIGSGRPAIALPEISALSESHFFDVRHFSSGTDLLFDCQLRGKQ